MRLRRKVCWIVFLLLISLFVLVVYYIPNYTDLLDIHPN